MQKLKDPKTSIFPRFLYINNSFSMTKIGKNDRDTLAAFISFCISVPTRQAINIGQCWPYCEYIDPI